MGRPKMLTVTLETVTPLFLSGADGRTPELRPPSVRGVLRYWLRAVLGGMIGHGDTALKTLRCAETQVFGSTEGSGAVVIRANWRGKEPSTVRENVLPHPSATHPARLQGYPDRETFEVHLIRRGDFDLAWRCAIGALLLLVSHGGLGKRARRGWGSLRVADHQTHGGDLPPELARWFQVTEIRSPQEWIIYQQGICRDVAKVCKGLIDDCKGSPGVPRFPSEFPIVTPQSRRFVWAESFPNWLAAIGEFGEREHGFLKSNPIDAEAFGFAEGRRRQASPLWMRIFPMCTNGEKTFFVGMCLLEPWFREANYEAVRRFIEIYPVVTRS
jgi:CRISPR type III-B/RAMP module RAMP protein Cmr1